VRDRSGQARDRRRAVALADSLVEWLDADADQMAVGPLRRPRRPKKAPEPPTSERVTLIEFMWFGAAGAQPVILVEREWLQ
jgi:hypothetical protein